MSASVVKIYVDVLESLHIVLDDGTEKVYTQADMVAMEWTDYQELISYTKMPGGNQKDA